MAEFELWLRDKLVLVSQKSKLAEAIRYALSRWTGLARFLDDGHIEIDNNVVERSIRPIALNRKNALFAGSDGGGEQWATIASLVETCKLNGIDPQAYLADANTRIVAGHPQSQLDDLLPWTYAKPPLRAVAREQRLPRNARVMECAWCLHELLPKAVLVTYATSRPECG